jgi:hypothetical protein
MASDVARAESRILPILTVIALVALLHSMPNRYVLLPSWFAYALGGVLSVSLLAAGMLPGTLWPRVERWAVGVFVAIGFVTQVVSLKDMIEDILFHRRQLSAITLLATAIAIWVVNILIFTFIYWQMDRGGPQGRAGGWRGRADLAFAHGDDADGVPADWRPTFADYLYLGYNTSTAFSPTDTLPLTTRAKMLMMAESTISLITLVIVAARAINVLK